MAIRIITLVLLISTLLGIATSEHRGYYKSSNGFLNSNRFYAIQTDDQAMNAFEVKFANDLNINLYHIMYYHIKHTRPLNCHIPIEFKQRWQRLLVILVISGDIALNPGPIRFPCGSCAKPCCYTDSMNKS